MGEISIDKTTIEGLYVIRPIVQRDKRGYFMETYNQSDMHNAGLDMVFVQDNQSVSVKGVLRGLHIQKKYPQGKLVRVIQGSVYDVAVDLRKDSSTYAKWYGLELSEENKKQLYIPPNFAHGFFVMSDRATVCYKVTEYWHLDDEIGIPWDDRTLDIKWPIPEGRTPIVAEKDRHYLPLSETRV